MMFDAFSLPVSWYHLGKEKNSVDSKIPFPRVQVPYILCQAGENYEEVW